MTSQQLWEDNEKRRFCFWTLTSLRGSASGGVPVQQAFFFSTSGSASKLSYDASADGKCVGEISLCGSRRQNETKIKQQRNIDVIPFHVLHYQYTILGVLKQWQFFFFFLRKSNSTSRASRIQSSTCSNIHFVLEKKKKLGNVKILVVETKKFRVTIFRVLFLFLCLVPGNLNRCPVGEVSY